MTLRNQIAMLFSRRRRWPPGTRVRHIATGDIGDTEGSPYQGDDGQWYVKIRFGTCSYTPTVYLDLWERAPEGATVKPCESCT